MICEKIVYLHRLVGTKRCEKEKKKQILYWKIYYNIFDDSLLH